MTRNPHDSPKQWNEMRVARQFADVLRVRGASIVTVKPGDIALREPDAVCQSQDGLIGIEIATGSYDEQEHRDSWALLRNQPEQSSRYLGSREGNRSVPFAPRVLVNFTDSLIAELQQAFGDHCRKSYSVPSYLVLDATLPPMTIEMHGPQIVAALKWPASVPFLGVFVAVTRNNSNETVFFECPAGVAGMPD